MVLRPPDRKPPEPAGTYKRLRGDLERAEAELRKILRLAPRATEKYPEIGQAARAVLHALTRAVQDHADADSAWRRYELLAARENFPLLACENVPLSEAGFLACARRGS